MPSRRKANILIIDNDDGVVQALTTRLSANGYICIVAGTGAQGLAAFNAGPIDLVITDLNMPALNGIELVRKVREISDVPVIIVTGFHREFREKLSGLADLNVLEKPFKSRDLVDLVELELAMRRQQRAA